MTRQAELSPAEVDRICALGRPRPNGQRLSAGQIAILVGRPRGVVAWTLYRQGLRRRAQARRAAPYRRADGTLVTPFSEAEDNLITKLRCEGRSCRLIAAELETQLGSVRKPRAIAIRLIMLASFEDAEEEAREALAA